MQNLIKSRQFIHKMLRGNEILIITKCHNSIVNLRKLTVNNLNLDIVKVSAYAQIYQTKFCR